MKYHNTINGLILVTLLLLVLINISIGNEIDQNRFLRSDDYSADLFNSLDDEQNFTVSYTNESGDGLLEGEHGHGDERIHLVVIDLERIKGPLIIGIWLFLACLGKIAFHMIPKLSRIFPESVMIISLGLVIGGFLYLSHPDPNKQRIVSPLTADIFFIYLLPPIILDAGYFMPNRLFFDHLGTILTFAVIGTIWNVVTIGISLYAVALTGIFGTIEDFPMLHILLFSSLISAVDPVAVLAVFEEIHVEEVLFILVFGESLLNDGVTVVLYHMFEGFSEIGSGNIMLIDIVYSLISFLLVALGGTAIGILWGFLTAFVTRFTYQVRVIEPIFIFIMSYLSYLNAELFHFSGILAITFCGITMKNYTEQNISQKSSTTIKYAMKMLASSAETVIFLFLGVATVHGTEHVFNGWFIFFTILFCSVYRVLGVLILSTICNRFRVQEIDFVQKFVMSYGGLRGAVAFALAITIDPSLITLAPTFVTTTIAVVFFTVFLQGATMKPLVAKIGVKKSKKRHVTMNERYHERTMDYIMGGIEDIVGKRGDHFFRTWFKRLNSNYLQPLLLHNPKAKEPKFLETLTHLKMQDALSYMRNKPDLDAESVAQILHSNIAMQQGVKEWNLDLGELEYEQSGRDLIDEKVHHVLAENFMHSKKHHSTYNRHAVHDVQLRTHTDFNTKMVLHAKRQAAIVRVKNNRNQKMKLQHGNRKSLEGRNSADMDPLEKAAMFNLAFINDDGSTAESFDPAAISKPRYSIAGPTAAETMFPWKRFTDDDIPTTNRRIQRSTRSTEDYPEEEPQTMAEILLPWKRNEDDLSYEINQIQKDMSSDWSNFSPDTEIQTNPSDSLTNIDTIEEDKKIDDLLDRRFKALNTRRASLEHEMPTLRNSAKRDNFRRRSTMADMLTSQKGSISDPFAKNSMKRRGNTEKTEPSNPVQEYKLNARQTGDSLLNTIIVEEENIRPRTGDKNDHVVNINIGDGTHM